MGRDSGNSAAVQRASVCQPWANAINNVSKARSKSLSSKTNSNNYRLALGVTGLVSFGVGDAELMARGAEIVDSYVGSFGEA